MASTKRKREGCSAAKKELGTQVSTMSMQQTDDIHMPLPACKL